MTMKSMKKYIQSLILLIILTIISIFHTGNPYLCVLIAGVLMVLLTIRNLLAKQNVWFFVLQLILSGAFSIISKIFCSYLIFYECRFIKSRYINIFYSPAVYFIVQLFLWDKNTPVILLNALILTIVSIIIFFVENLIIKYISAQEQISEAVSVTAVNEMYEKKLNQELVIKNYLADKNARLEERENISRNIHNSVGHSITAAIVTLDAADMLYDSNPDIAREKMNTANDRIRTSLDTIRRAVRVLDSDSEYISMSDLISEIESIADNFAMDTMIRVQANFAGADGSLMIPHEHTEFLAGAVQELLTNGLRHGKANLFTLSVTSDSRHIKLVVRDNGKSNFNEVNKVAKISEGFGLRKLISYVDKRGGSTVFKNENGFKSEITLPIYKEGANG